MDGALFITMIIKHWLGKDESSVNNAIYRERVQLHAQTRVDEIWVEDFAWTYKEGVAQLAAATGDCAAPSDFDSFGTQGDMWFPSAPRRPFYFKRPQYVMELRRIHNTAVAQFPTYYSEAEAFSNGQKRLICDRPLLSAALDIALWYKALAPIIVDSDDSDPDAPSMLEMIPVQFQLTCLRPGVIALLQEDDGDQRAPGNEARFTKGLAKAIVDQRQGQHANRHPLPAYGRGGNTYGYGNGGGIR